MNVFYHPHISQTCILSEEESKHIRVLRLKKGDEINLADGKGGFYKAEIIDANPKKCSVKILPFNQQPITSHQKPAHLHLAVAPTKNIERYEWFLEKATEIGISEITPLVCEKSERKILKTERLEKILVSAMKQSLNLFLPKLNPLRKFSDFVTASSILPIRIPPLQLERRLGGEVQKFIAHYSETHLKSVYQKGKDALILIGPEGDFSEEEINLAKENGFTEVSLGNTRLRTETAAVVACHTIRLMNE